MKSLVLLFDHDQQMIEVEEQIEIQKKKSHTTPRY